MVTPGPLHLARAGSRAFEREQDGGGLDGVDAGERGQGAGEVGVQRTGIGREGLGDLLTARAVPFDALGDTVLVPATHAAGAVVSFTARENCSAAAERDPSRQLARAERST